uniref:Immunoglobulin subtype domain-containing protein n=1 Tax=Acanthochromis polyacanthus TaxID=80966 RepID=A0A3Q1E9U6_9TELE
MFALPVVKWVKVNAACPAKLVNRTYPRRISSIFSSTQEASFYGGLETDRFGLTSNGSTLFFKIKRVEFSDSGFYFCGFYYKTHPVIVNSKYLKIPGKNVLIDGDIVIAINTNLDSDDLNYVAVTFRTKVNRREPEVIYSATRYTGTDAVSFEYADA